METPQINPLAAPDEGAYMGGAWFPAIQWIFTPASDVQAPRGEQVQLDSLYAPRAYFNYWSNPVPWANLEAPLPHQRREAGDTQERTATTMAGKASGAQYADLRAPTPYDGY